MSVEIITKKAPGKWQGEAWFVKRGDEHFIVSGVDALMTGWEVLVFPADEQGEVSSFIEVAGGRGISHDAAIAELEDS